MAQSKRVWLRSRDVEPSGSLNQIDPLEAVVNLWALGRGGRPNRDLLGFAWRQAERAHAICFSEESRVRSDISPCDRTDLRLTFTKRMRLQMLLKSYCGG